MPETLGLVEKEFVPQRKHIGAQTEDVRIEGTAIELSKSQAVRTLGWRYGAKKGWPLLQSEEKPREKGAQRREQNEELLAVSRAR